MTPHPEFSSVHQLRLAVRDQVLRPGPGLWKARRVIEAVFFDGDDTLWDFRALMRRALSATLTMLRAERPCPATISLTVDAMVADRVAIESQLRGEETNLERLRLAAFTRTLNRLGLFEPDLAERLNGFYLKERFRNVELYPDVMPTLTTLATTYRLGLLSNGNGYPERSGLAGTFSAVILSQDHGYAKPDSCLFDIATQAMGLPADRLAMIGDSIVNDVVGAQQAGWTGVWLNRDGSPTPTECQPDATVKTLLDAPAVLVQR